MDGRTLPDGNAVSCTAKQQFFMHRHQGLLLSEQVGDFKKKGCVAGRGVSTQHRRRTPGEDSVEVATVAVDYCFLRNTPGEDSIHVLVLRDRETRLLSGLAVPVKGAVVDWTSQQVVRDLERLGHHGRLVIWCDREAALKCLVSEAARMRGRR